MQHNVAKQQQQSRYLHIYLLTFPSTLPLITLFSKCHLISSRWSGFNKTIKFDFQIAFPISPCLPLITAPSYLYAKHTNHKACYVYYTLEPLSAAIMPYMIAARSMRHVPPLCCIWYPLRFVCGHFARGSHAMTQPNLNLAPIKTILT